MFIPNLKDFLATHSGSNLELDWGADFYFCPEQAEVHYVTSGTVGGSCTASHFREVTAEWLDYGYIGRMFLRNWCAETQTYSDELYVVLKTA